MIRRLNIFVIISLISFIFVLIGCSEQKSSNENDKSNETDTWNYNLLLGTSSQGGTYYVWGGGWADILGENLPGLDIYVEVTGGPTSNIQLIQSDEMDLGFVTTWLGGEGYNGEGWADESYDKMRTIFTMYPSVMHMYSLQGSGIETIYDFNGKHVSTGAPGSTSAEAGQGLLDSLGIKPDKISAVPTNTGIDGLRDGTIDAGFAVTGVPGPFMLDLETNHEVQHIGLTDDDMNKLLSDFPYWDEIDVPAGTYKHQDEDMKLVAFWNVAVASADLPDDLVYEIVKTTFEKHDELVAVDPTAEDTIIENITYTTIPLHPGAVKYYEENGIDIPDELLPPEGK